MDFKPKMATDKEFNKFVGTDVDSYENTMQTSAIIRWEAFKACLRGHVINYASTKFKEIRLKRQKFESKIQTLQNQFFNNSTVKADNTFISTAEAYMHILIASKTV